MNPKFVCQVSVFTTKKEAVQLARREKCFEPLIIEKVKTDSGLRFAVCREMPRDGIPFGHLLEVTDAYKILQPLKHR